MKTEIFEATRYSLEVETGGDPWHHQDADMLNMLTRLEQWHAVTPLAKFEFTLQPGGHFNYICTLADGRVWTQQIKVFPATASMTFDVPDHWTLENFLPHRVIRDLIIEAVRAHNLTKFEVVML